MRMTINLLCLKFQPLQQYSLLLLFAEAEKVGKTAFNPITALEQASLSDLFSKRRDQDPECNPTVVLQTL